MDQQTVRKIYTHDTYFVLLDDRQRDELKETGRNPMPSTTLWGNVENISNYLHHQNQDRYGIFFAVNHFRAPNIDGSNYSRDASNVIGVRSLFVDLDHADRDLDLEELLPPSSIIESSPGRFHLYWYVADCPMNLFTSLQRALAKKFGGDTIVIDLPRIMRCPGFYHQKRPGQEFLVQVIDGCGETYSVEQVVRALDLTVEPVALEVPAYIEKSPVGSIEMNEIQQALKVFSQADKEDREIWLKIGMALKSRLGDAGFVLWDEWSRQAKNYGGTEKAWSSFKEKEGGVHIETLFQLAHKRGFGEFEPLTAEERKNILGWLDDLDPAPVVVEEKKEEVAVRKQKGILRYAWEISASPRPHFEPVISDVLDLGQSMQIVGPPKTKKSFVSQQLAMCISQGIPFLDLEIPKARKTLYIQFEVDTNYFWLRHHDMETKLFGEGFQNSNLLCHDYYLDEFELSDFEQISQTIVEHKIEVVIFDPLYMMIDGDESKISDIQPYLKWFKRLRLRHNIALIYCHHEAKGAGVDRSIRDRGSGSSLTARAYSVCMSLLPHPMDPEVATSVQWLNRNHQARPGVVFDLVDGVVQLSQTLSATTEKRGKPQTKIEDQIKIVQQKYAGEKIVKTSLVEKIYREIPGFTQRSARSAVEEMLVRGGAVEELESAHKKGGKKIYVTILETEGIKDSPFSSFSTINEKD